MSKVINFGFFIGVFSLFLFTCAPHVPPYRDSGEMAAALLTLGIAHAPGYPLYIILGKLFSLIPLGNLVYRIDVFSALAGAISVVLMFHIFKKWIPSFPAFICAALFGASIRFWELGCVPEMYTLGILWLCLILAASFLFSNSILTFFLFGLGLGVRMDTLLLMPLFIFWFRKDCAFKNWVWNFLFLLAGLSIFLFLPIRSHQNPVLDWSNPESLGALLNILTRKSYGGTLDLLSLSYAKGANFIVNLKLYFIQFIESFSWGGMLLAIVGVLYAFKKYPRLGIFILFGFLITGPLFLFLANMPPNPHALAIIQASYLNPDLFLSFFIGLGLAFLWRLIKWKYLFYPAFMGMLIFNVHANFAKATKRNNFYVQDYIGNVFKSSPPNSVSAFHKDVQLFSLWEAQVVGDKRKDVGIVATGLSASPWYWDMVGRWGVKKAPGVSLKEPDGWEMMKARAGTRPLLIGQETEFIETPRLKSSPCGLVSELIWNNESQEKRYPFLLNDICVYRGRNKYGETPDFFSSDLIGDLARAYHKQGFRFFLDMEWEKADWFMKRAQSIDPTFARPVSDRAYMFFMSGKLKEGNSLHKLTVQKNEKLLKLAIKYKSLPDVLGGIKRDLSEAYVNYGASSEKLGSKNEARASYRKAIALTSSPQAHYNLAVTYWGNDWEKVVQSLESALKADSQFESAKKYLTEAKKHLGLKKK